MRSRILCLVLVLSVASFEAKAANDRCSNCDLGVALLVGGFTLWGAVIVGGVTMIGISTAPQGDFNQEYSCENGQLSSCCTAVVANNQIVGENCTLNNTPNTRCNGKTLFCARPAGLAQAPYVLQKWAKDTQIAGAVLFSVAGAAAIVFGIGAICAM